MTALAKRRNKSRAAVYLECLRDRLDDFVDGKVRHRCQMADADGCAVCIVQVDLVRDARRALVVQYERVTPQRMKVLRESLGCTGRVPRRGKRIFSGATTYIVKPKDRHLWRLPEAWHDAQELIADVLTQKEPRP